LYISYDGLTDPLGQSQILPYLKELSKHGFEFTILSFEKKDRFQKEKELVVRSIGTSPITWKPLWFTRTPPILAKIYDRRQLKKRAVQLHRLEKFDLIHCRSYVSAEIGLYLKRKWGARFLFDMRGFWADEKVDNGQWNLRNYLYKFIYKYYKKKENQFLLSADSIITLTQASRNYLLSKPAYKNLNIEVIPCCADFDHFDFHKVFPEEIDNVRRSLKIPDSARIISYLGSVGGWYLTKEMFSFFKLLMMQAPEYMLLILTKDNAEKVRAEALHMGIPDHKVFITYSNRERLPQFMALSHCSIFFIKSSFSKMASSPTKHAELMGMGIPIVCNSIGDTGDIVKNTKTGIIVDTLDNNSFSEAISRIGEFEKMDREYIRDCGKKFFDLQAGVQKYLQEYDRILN
jgi:glycosyltransferase involved in cell wall biosynthesis